MQERMVEAMQQQIRVIVYLKDSGGVVIGTIFRINPIDIEVKDDFDRLFAVPVSSVLAVQYVDIQS